MDGDFLLDLRAEDLRDVLGVEHELHIRKILLSRDRLAPLDAMSQARLRAVQAEEDAAKRRGGGSILQASGGGGGGGMDSAPSAAGAGSNDAGDVPPDRDVVFSQVSLQLL